MQEAKTYRQYAADCARMAQKLNANDSEILLRIAEAWEQRAQEAERREKKSDDSAPLPGAAPTEDGSREKPGPS